MFSHTQSLEDQAQKLSVATVDQPGEPQPAQPEPTVEPEPPVDEPTVPVTEPSPDLIAEAEQRGFQRAMALRVTELFNRPTSESPTFPSPDADEIAASDIVFLSRVRRSIWD